MSVLAPARRRYWSRALVALAVWLAPFEALEAHQDPDAPGTAAPVRQGNLPSGYVGPPPPIPPAVIARDGEGHVTVRAVRLTSPIAVDGRLDEAVYASTPSMSGFTQTEPAAGKPALERTEVWVFYDNDNIYVVGRCWETEPDRMTANEMRRDSTNIAQNDNFAWSFDTFYDRRNGYMFQTNPLAGRMDGQTTNQDSTNFDWNPVWTISSGRFEGGWIIEAAIPFKSLRYGPGRTQVWGFQVRRRSIWRNEISYLSPIPAEIGVRGLRPSLSATMVGLEVPSGSRNLEVKPYGIADLTSDVTTAPPYSNDLGADFGVDAKYGITQNLTADFTYNTDFAQVEADEQQVNLTRFNLQFPEKRDFFLEGRGIFALAGEGGDTPSLFYSRRIGLEENFVVPIQTGARLTGRAAGFNVGAINVQTDSVDRTNIAGTNFSVVRLKRDILRRSSIGGLFTHRSVSTTGVGSNTAYGLDGAFSFYDKLTINTYWAQTQTETRPGRDVSYRGNLIYDGDRYGIQGEHLLVGENFNPEVGFVRRDDVRRSFGQFRFSPRPKSIKSVRKFSYIGSVVYIEDGTGRLETRELEGQFGTEFQSGDLMNLTYVASYESVNEPFRISPGVTLPVGDYEFGNLLGSYTFGQQRQLLSGMVTAEYGSFYNGDKTGFSISAARVKFTPKLSAQPSYAANWIDLVQGSFSTHLVGARITYTATPMMFVSALLQYNSTNETVSANVRLRWEYQAGSELFVVFNEQRDSQTSRAFPTLRNRAIIVKITRLLRF